MAVEGPLPQRALEHGERSLRHRQAPQKTRGHGQGQVGGLASLILEGRKEECEHLASSITILATSFQGG